MLNRKFSLFLALFLLPGYVQAQTASYKRCELKEGTSYAATLQDALADSTARIADACRQVRISSSFAVIAAPRSVSTQASLNETYDNQCIAGNSVYCRYVYKVQWQASCCERSQI